MSGVLHITNARRWTGEHDRRELQRGDIAIAGGRIAAIGPTNALPGATIIDAADCVVTPGLVDAHMHLVMGAKARAELNLAGITSREAFEAAIAERHRALPAGAWLIARGWSSENWQPSVDPDKSWLRTAGDRPCVCHRMDHHAALVNDAVMQMCGPLTNDPPGGRILRDAAGEPTGLFVEAAAWKLINPRIPEPPAEELQRATLDAARWLASLGITAVGSMEYQSTVERVLLPIAEKLPIRVQVTLLDRDWPLDFSFAHAFKPTGQLNIIGFKTFIDGTLGSRTARMLQNYADDPGNRGMLVELAGEGRLIDWIRLVAAEGFSPSMHAIGDEAARLALDAIDQIDETFRARVQPRIEHAQQIDRSDIPRFRGRIASMQPLHKADDGRYVEKRVGTHRLAGSFAFRSLKEAGAVLAFGSDWPIVSPDPIAGMQVAITGKLADGNIFAPEQNLTVEETLAAYTKNAAFALQLDDGVPSLRTGSHADIVIWDRDPFAADWLNDPPRVELTICDGKITFDGRGNRGGAEAQRSEIVTK